MITRRFSCVDIRRSPKLTMKRHACRQPSPLGFTVASLWNIDRWHLWMSVVHVVPQIHAMLRTC